MILAKGAGAALALIVMAGFVGQASADLRQYCDSYARDVANRKTNSGADVLGGTVGRSRGARIGGVGGTVLGARVTSDRYKRSYVNAYERCVDNYEGTRAATAEDIATDQKVTDKKVPEATDKKVPEATDKKVPEATAKKVAANEVTDKKPAAAEPTKKKAAASQPTEKKIAANEPINKDKACARKYRSFDPQTGKYKSYGGKWRSCRL
jgi:hypothetical protein